jgi:hypothetical protein
MTREHRGGAAGPAGQDRPHRYEQLLRTLMSHCRGEPRAVRIVRVTGRDQEDARRATREEDRAWLWLQHQPDSALSECSVSARQPQASGPNASPSSRLRAS